MKIYYNKSNGVPHLYFIDSKGDTLFQGNVRCGDMDTVYITVVMTSDELAIINSAKPVSTENALQFNRSVNQEHNIGSIISVVRSVYPDITDDDFYKSVDRDIRRNELTDRIVRETKCPIYFSSDIYRGLIHYINLWKNDDDRIVKYYVERLVPELVGTYHGTHPMIDIFGETNPTKHSLLHSFYSTIIPVDKYIDEAVVAYPDEADIDKAYYMAKQSIQEAVDEFVKDRKK